jgi:hypothetical protein
VRDRTRLAQHVSALAEQLDDAGTGFHRRQAGEVVVVLLRA